jgi:hypothetical protein
MTTAERRGWIAGALAGLSALTAGILRTWSNYACVRFPPRMDIRFRILDDLPLHAVRASHFNT